MLVLVLVLVGMVFNRLTGRSYPHAQLRKGHAPEGSGGFTSDDLDAALHWHPGDSATVMNIRLLAINQLQIEFFGRTAHAGAAPWLGRSAVHAAELFAHGLNLMREHVQPTVRMHYKYDQAGLAPNVVPDYARLTVIDDRPRVVAIQHDPGAAQRFRGRGPGFVDVIGGQARQLRRCKWVLNLVRSWKLTATALGIRSIRLRGWLISLERRRY